METGIDSPETQPSDLSLRERKKRRTRARIADAAVVMFARKGFEAVSVADVAQAAEVSEQTVYNYFSTKEALVLDEAEAFAERFRAMVRERDGGMTVLDAVRAEALAFLSGLAQRPDTPDRKGSMPYLVATCPTIRRHWLALMERYAHVVAAALVAQSGGKLPLASAKVLGGALMSVFAVIVDELGQTMADDAPVLPRLKALRRQIERAIDQMANGFA